MTALKKRAILDLGCPSFRPSVIISFPLNDIILPSFALILTRSRLGLLYIVFRRFEIELWPLTDVRILFPLNIYRMN